MRLAAHASFRRTVISNGLLAALVCGLPAGAWAQVQLPDAAGDVAGGAANAAAAPQGAEQGSKRTFSFVPRLSLQQTFTSNVDLRAGGRSDQITEINPGFRLMADGSHLKAYVDYTLRDVIYAQNSDKSSTQSILNAFGSWRSTGNWASIDFSSSITQQAISAFGPQGNDNGPINPNLTETFNTQLSPSFRGRLGGVVDYEARYTWAITHSPSNPAADVTSNVASLRLGGDTGASRLNWNVNLGSQRFAYDNGRISNDDSLRAVLGYAFSPQLKLSLIGGRETNNYANLADETHGLSGWSLNWNPSNATHVSLSRENRFFGESHSISLEHRTPRTEWRYSDVRDVTATPGQNGNPTVGSIYDLLYAQFASLEPDPIRRAELVNNFLATYGLNPNSKPTGGFLTAAVSLQRAQNLSFAILGVRDTITFIATQTNTRRLDGVSTANDDLSNGATVQQRGFSAAYAHRLTPASSINILASQQESSGSTVTADAMTRTLNVNFTTRVGTQSSATVGARRVVSEGGIAPYSESALTGSLNLQF